MAVWPVSLPQKPLAESYSEGQETQIARTSMEMGPAKQRRRFTARVDTFSCRFLMDESQVVTFKDFFNNTLEGGALAYDWDDPRTGTTRSFRFRGSGDTAPFSIEGTRSGELYYVSVELEVV